MATLGNKTQTEFPDCALIRAKFLRDDRVSVEPRKSSFGVFPMLVARRDPPFHVDPHEAAPLNSSVYPVARAPRLTRFVTVIQLVGSLLAVPVGIASAYSFYRANFSPETTCQSLRSGIVAMLDKSVDAGTRRVLVRRDVEAFEKSCAAVDPDATAAFKALLDVEKASASAAAPAPTVPKVQHVETAPKEAVRKVEQRPQAVPKQPVANAPAAATEPAHRDAAVSDTQWLDAVRQALVTHKSEPHKDESAKARTAIEPAARQVPHEAVLSAPIPESGASVAPMPAPAPASAPTLPPAISIAPPPARQVEVDHPVPPAAIPDSMSPPEKADEAKTDGQGHSRIRRWISEIPLLGPVVENGRQ